PSAPESVKESSTAAVRWSMGTYNSPSTSSDIATMLPVNSGTVLDAPPVSVLPPSARGDASSSSPQATPASRSMSAIRRPGRSRFRMVNEPQIDISIQDAANPALVPGGGVAAGPYSRPVPRAEDEDGR